MHTVVVFESHFGNTRDIARAVAEGLAEWSRPTVIAASDAPEAIGETTALVVAGGPTHTFSMSRAATRHDAQERGAHLHFDAGLREWIDAVELTHPTPLATFDTHVSQRWVPGSASRSAARHGRNRGFIPVASESFYVQEMQGPLVRGELERARTWARSLSSFCLPVEAEDQSVSPSSSSFGRT